MLSTFDGSRAFCSEGGQGFQRDLAETWLADPIHPSVHGIHAGIPRKGESAAGSRCIAEADTRGAGGAIVDGIIQDGCSPSSRQSVGQSEEKDGISTPILHVWTRAGVAPKSGTCRWVDEGGSLCGSCRLW